MNQQQTNRTNGRRDGQRHAIAADATISFRGLDGLYITVEAETKSLSQSGISCSLADSIPARTKFVQITLNLHGAKINQTGHIVWISEDQKQCGVKFEGKATSWLEAFATAAAMVNTPMLTERRANERRGVEVTTGAERRQQSRRFIDLVSTLTQLEDKSQNIKVKSFLRSKSTSHTSDTVIARREWIDQITAAQFKHVAYYSEEPKEFIGKVENPIGVCHIPLGVAGPLRINGDHAKGTFYVPLATTEGALVTSYTLGSHIITRSGGANVVVLKDELRVAPMLVFKSLKESRAFTAWIKKNHLVIKKIAEGTSKNLILNDITCILNGRRIIVNFHYNTADAMGMNMATKATEFACQFITASVKPEEFWLRSNFNANKKVTANNFINGYGKTVTADVTIPRRLISILNTTPEKMAQYFSRTLLANTHAVQIGGNGHFANGIAAMYIACGQDVASVANSHVGISTCEVTKSGDLYFSAYLTNLLLGTVGGGTEFGTAKECLRMLGCVGTGKAKKLAEIVTAVCLAGEIGVCASIVNGTYVYAHETFGRNPPAR